MSYHDYLSVHDIAINMSLREYDIYRAYAAYMQRLSVFYHQHAHMHPTVGSGPPQLWEGN